MAYLNHTEDKWAWSKGTQWLGGKVSFKYLSTLSSWKCGFLDTLVTKMNSAAGVLLNNLINALTFANFLLDKVSATCLLTLHF